MRSAATCRDCPRPSRSCSRTCSGAPVRATSSDDDVRALAAWPGPRAEHRVHARPRPDAGLHGRARGGGPGRDAQRHRSGAGADPSRSIRSFPADLMIDHSVSRSTCSARPRRYARNIEWEYRRNAERYALLRWAQQAFDGLRVVPPGAGICHQVNLEHLGQVVTVRDGVAFPDTLVGHRLTHDHDQRPGRARLGRRRHRGGGRDAGPADVHATAAHGRRADDGRASRRAPPRPTSC